MASKVRKAIKEAITAHIKDGGLVTAPDMLMNRVFNAIEKYLDDGVQPLTRNPPQITRISAPVICYQCKRRVQGYPTRPGEKDTAWTCARHRCKEGKMATSLGKPQSS